MNKIKENSSIPIEIVIIGKYTDLPDSYMSIIEALKHSSTTCNVKISTTLINSELFCDDSSNEFKSLNKFNGIIVPGGFGSRGSVGMLNVIEYARKRNIPFLGIGLGMQLLIIEYARNVLHLKDANTTEFNENTKYPLVKLLNISKKNECFNNSMMLGNYNIILKRDTILHQIYGNSDCIIERFRNKYVVPIDYKSVLEKNDLQCSGLDNDKNEKFIFAVEMPKNDYFIGVQYHPEFKSRPEGGHPIFNSFIRASFKKSQL